MTRSNDTCPILGVASDGMKDVDRISNLPEPVIHFIFSFLGTNDVIKARLVSRKWRALWPSMPYLDLITPSIRARPKLTESNKGRFKIFVNRALSSQDVSAYILRLRLPCFHSNYDDTLYMWIDIAVRRKVKELCLELHSDAPFELPHSLVTCESLYAMKISSYGKSSLMLPTVVGFSRVKSLCLEKIRLADSALFRNLISSCPRLEKLEFRCVLEDSEVLDISSTSMKILIISNIIIGGFSKVKAACPNLVSFTFDGRLASTISFEIEDLRYLQKATIELQDYQVPDPQILMPQILKAICNTHVFDLYLDDNFYGAVTSRKCFPTSFCNLTSLSLNTVRLNDWNMELITNMLVRSPNLKALRILFFTEEGSCGGWHLPKKTIPCLNFHLKTVELYLYNDVLEWELDLVRFLLSEGRVLQKMSILGRIHEEDMVTILEFPKSSPNVDITFVDDTC